MKISILASCLIVSLGAVTVAAQLPVPATPNIMLDAQIKTAGGGFQMDGVKKYAVTLGVSLRNLDQTPNQVLVEWFFFGKTHQDAHASKEFLVDSGTKEVAVKAGGAESFDIESKEVRTSNTATVNNIGIPGTGNMTTGMTTVAVATQHSAGTKLTGWIVRISVNGQLIAVKASAGDYEDAARDPAKLNALKGDQ